MKFPTNKKSNLNGEMLLEIVVKLFCVIQISDLQLNTITMTDTEYADVSIISF